jgi:hypothetical protein
MYILTVFNLKIYILGLHPQAVLCVDIVTNIFVPFFLRSLHIHIVSPYSTS